MLTTLMSTLLFLNLCSFTEMLLSRPTIFFSTIIGSLYPQNSISSFDIRLGDGIHIGSDEERAIVKCHRHQFSRIKSVIMLETFERWYIELHAIESRCPTERS